MVGHQCQSSPTSLRQRVFLQQRRQTDTGCRPPREWERSQVGAIQQRRLMESGRRSGPWMAGCRDFTLPSKISGWSVRAKPNEPQAQPLSVRTVPPVEINSKPRAAKPLAKWTIPVLSHTLRRLGREDIHGVNPLSLAVDALEHSDLRC